MTTHRRGDFRNTRRWKATARSVLVRDLYVCHWCGGKATQADHVIPCGAPHYGTKFDMENLVAACAPCNNGRNNPEWVAPSTIVAQARTAYALAASDFLSNRSGQHSPLANPSPQSRYPTLRGDYSRKRTERVGG